MELRKSNNDSQLENLGVSSCYGNGINFEFTQEAETPILWPPDVKNSVTGKDPDAEKD